MLSIRKWGGIAGLLQAVMSIVYLILLVGLQGGPELFSSAANVSAEVHSPGRIAFRLITLLFSLTILVLAMALRDRLHEGAPERTRLMVVAASIASAVFVLDAVISAYAGPGLASLAAQDLAQARSLTNVVDWVLNGMAGSYVFMTGWMAALAGSAAIGTGQLPRPLGWLLVLAGVVSILAVLLQFAFLSIPALQAVVLVLTLVWSAWLGIVLWGGK